MSEPTSDRADQMRLRSLQIIAGTFIATVIVLPILAVLLLGVGTPEVMWIVILAVLSLACAGFLAIMGFSIPPIEPDDRSPEQTALARFQASTILRLAVAEAPAIFALALAFVDGSALLSVLGSVVALALLGLFGWPTRQTIGRAERRLDAKGARSRLGEPPRQRGGPSGTSGGGYLPL